MKSIPQEQQGNYGRPAIPKTGPRKTFHHTHSPTTNFPAAMLYSDQPRSDPPRLPYLPQRSMTPAQPHHHNQESR